MKKYLLSILLTGSLCVAAKAFPETRTTFFTEGRVAFQVMVNGQAVNRFPERTVSLDWLQPGRHHIQVIAEGPRGRQAVYSGNIRLRPHHHAHYAVNVNRGIGLTLTLAEEVPLMRPGGRPGGHHGHHSACGGAGCTGSCWIMSPHQVTQIVYAMRYQSFDDDKLRVAQKALQSNPPILVDDLMTLLGQFAFDRHRLELAKYAYQKTADPENFFRVYNAFTFSSSHRELDVFLGRGNTCPPPVHYQAPSHDRGRGNRGRGNGYDRRRG